MSNHSKNESFDLLAHEIKISELYQNGKKQQFENPSQQIDAEVMAMAKQQLSDNSRVLTKEKMFEQKTEGYPSSKSKIKKWHWPFSMVASVGLLGVLFITQREYYIHPNSVVPKDVGLVNEAVMRAPDNSLEEVAVQQSLKTMKMAVSAKQYEERLDKEYAAMAS